MRLQWRRLGDIPKGLEGVRAHAYDSKSVLVSGSGVLYRYTNFDEAGDGEFQKITSGIPKKDLRMVAVPSQPKVLCRGKGMFLTKTKMTRLDDENLGLGYSVPAFPFSDIPQFAAIPEDPEPNRVVCFGSDIPNSSQDNPKLQVSYFDMDSETFSPVVETEGGFPLDCGYFSVFPVDKNHIWLAALETNKSIFGIFDAENNKFTNVEVTGEDYAPEEPITHYTTAVLDSRYLMFFGGTTSYMGPFDDSYLLDTKEKRWVPVENDGDVPDARTDAPATPFPGNTKRAFVFAGGKKVSVLNVPTFKQDAYTVTLEDKQ